jgi:hypothetical protein
MPNAIQNFVSDLEHRFEQLWNDLTPHVKQEATDAAKAVVDQAKAQVGQLAVQAGELIKTDLSQVAVQAMEKAQAIGIPLNDLPADQRPPTVHEALANAGVPVEVSGVTPAAPAATMDPTAPAADQKPAVSATTETPTSSPTPATEPAAPAQSTEAVPPSAQPVAPAQSVTAEPAPITPSVA